MGIQNEPVEDGSTDATRDEQIEGVALQTQQDVAIGSISPEDYEAVLQQRFEEAGIEGIEKGRFPLPS